MENKFGEAHQGSKESQENQEKQEKQESQKGKAILGGPRGLENLGHLGKLRVSGYLGKARTSMKARKKRNTRISRNTRVSRKTRKNRKPENVLQNTPYLQAHSRQNKGPKWVKNHFLCLYALRFHLLFEPTICIQHHFAFLFGCRLAFFSSPITRFQPLKPHFLMAILPFLAMCFMVLKCFVYTIAMDIYAFRLAFCSILHCVLHHITLRFAPKHTPFSTKTHFILHQNAPYLAPKRTPFCTKTPQNWC